MLVFSEFRAIFIFFCGDFATYTLGEIKFHIDVFIARAGAVGPL